MNPRSRHLFRTGLAYLAVAVLLALPALAAPLSVPDAGVGKSTVIYAMNTGGPLKKDPANLMVEFVNPGDGSQAGTAGASLSPMGVVVWNSEDEVGASSWIGSAVVYADRELATTGRVIWSGGTASDGVTQGAYTAFSEGSTQVFLPNLLRRPWMYSTISVQNLGSTPAEFTIKYYATGSTTPFATKVDAGVPAGAHRYYDLMYPNRSTDPTKVPTIPWDDYLGAAIVTSDGNDIAAVVTNHWNQFAGVYQGVPAEEADSTVYVPSVFKRKFNNWYAYTGFQIQNTDELYTARVELRLYDRAGNESVPPLVRYVGPMASLRFNTRYWGDTAGEPFWGLGWDWLGSGVVEANRKVVVQVDTYYPGLSSGSCYNGMPPGQGSAGVFVPYVSRYVSGGNWAESCGVIVQNLSDQTNAVDFYMYSPYGTSNWTSHYLLHGTLSIDAWATKSFNTRYSARMHELGDWWRGTAYLSGQHNIGVAVNCQRWDSAFTYNGINE